MRGDLADLQEGAKVGNKYAIAALAKCPEVEWPWLWSTYIELTTERQVGMSAGQIPYSAIRDMADEFELTGNFRVLFLYVMRGLDRHFLAKSAEKSKAGQSK